MKKIKNVIGGIAIALSAIAFAHEGHDDVPGGAKANHGGVVKSGKEINLEYVVNGNEVILYPVSHEGKDLPAADVNITGTSKSPKAKPEALKFTNQGGFYKANVDFKGAYRSEVNVTTEYKGKKDNFKFQVEKQ